MRPRAANLEYDSVRKLYQSKISEEHVLREIVDRLWLQAKIKVFRVRERIPDNRKRWQQLSTPGIPDLIGFIPWRTPIQPPAVPDHTISALPLFIEVKRPGGKHRPMQERFISEALADGCCAFFAESWGHVVLELGKFGIKLEGDSNG